MELLEKKKLGLDALRGEEGEDGLDLTDSRKLEEWNLKALNVLADAFMRETGGSN